MEFRLESDHPSVIRISPILRWTLIVSSGFFLLHAIIYGPGRGLTLIPYDEDWSGLAAVIRVAAYSLFLLGGLACKKHLKTAILLLAAGLIFRGTLEVFISAIKYLYQGVTFQKVCDNIPGFLKLSSEILVFYWFAFILPALLLFDCNRLRKLRKTSESREDASA